MLDRVNAKTKGENTPHAISHEDVAKLLSLLYVRQSDLFRGLVARNSYHERYFENLSAAQVISIGEKVINGLGQSFFPLLLKSDNLGKSIRTAIRLGASVTLEARTDISRGEPEQEIFGRRQYIKATPLMQAVANYARKMENIKAIIAGGADINHVSSEGFTALHVAAAFGAGRIRALIQLGADPNIPLPSGNRLIDVASSVVRRALEKSNISPSPAQGRLSTDSQASKTPVVPPAEEAFQRVLGLLRSSGTSLQSDVVATHKDTPPLLLLAHKAGFSPGTLIELIALGADPNFPVEGGLTLLGAALIQAHRAGVDAALAIGTTRIFTDSQVKYVLPRTGEEVNQDDLTRIALQRLQTESDPAFREACQLLKRLRSPYQFYLFSEALQEVSDHSTGQMGLSFYQIASNMLYIKPTERPVGQLLEKIRMSGATQGHHSESDLLILLNDPAEPRKRDLSDNAVWRHIQKTTPKQGIDESKKHWALSRIGSQTYSFSRWRFDAQGTKQSGDNGVRNPSLLEDFGGAHFSREAEKAPWNSQFGSQMLFRPGTKQFSYQAFDSVGKQRKYSFDAKTTVIMRQGYLLVHNPKKGMLIVRNSSPDFGRALLPQTAYFVSASEARTYSEADLLAPFPRVFSVGKNPLSFTTTGEFDSVNSLLNELIGFEDEFRKWKFDTEPTSAWIQTDDKKPKLIGAHRSRGYQNFVNHLEHLLEHAGDNDLALAFVNPDFPSWRQYTFTDTDGAQQRFIPLNSDTIEAMRSLGQKAAAAEGTRNEILKFFQQAGLDKRAELVIQAF
jgi:hypothetical protein